MNLEKFTSFLDIYQPKEQAHFHCGTITSRYFYLAEVQIELFRENIKRAFEINSPAGRSSESCYSHAYGFYALIRTSLESSSQLSTLIQPLDNSDALKEYGANATLLIRPIIDTANNFVKHPLKSESDTLFYEPGGLDSCGNVTVYEWSSVKNDHFQSIEFNPLRDFELVRTHIEKLGELYSATIHKNTAPY